MRKDVIYIDVEDDITAVIDKLKQSSEAIIALVPPKGNAVLQSIVNLKLLNRAAKSADKQPVIVTNNNALIALAGGLGMYVAKNLQSKPYVPNAEKQPELGDDELEVSATPVAAAAGVVGTKVALDDGDEFEVHADELVADLDAAQDPDGVKNDPKKAATSKKPGKKVPNFNSFRKKLLVFGGLALALIIVFIFFIARPKAEIVVRAETTPVDIAYEATLTGSGASNPEAFSFRPQVQEEVKSITQDFTPTGKKDVGQKATGSVTFSTNSISSLGTIPAGTVLRSSNGKLFTTNTAVTLTLANALTGVSVGVTARDAGSSSNGESGAVSGAPSGVSASLDAPTSGGTDKVVTVVSQADVDKAKAEIEKKDSGDTLKELEAAFGGEVVIINDSFDVTVGEVTSEPAVGQEANEGKLTARVTYTLLALNKAELKQANEAAISKEMDNKDQQQVYKDGLEDVQFEKVKLDGTNGTYKITAVGQFGPKLDVQAVANEVANKKVGEVRSYIQGLPGVKSTEINISPFWSRSTPSADKIQIKLDVDESAIGS